MRKKILCLTLGMFLLATPTVFAEDMARKLTLEESITIAIENNLTMNLAQKDIEIAEHQYKEAKNSRWGGLTITNSVTHRDAQDDELYKDGLNVSVPLYSGGKLEAQREYQKLNLESNKNTYQRTKEQVTYDTQDAYYSVLRTERLVEVAKEYVTNMQAHLKVARAKYNNGMVAKLDVLNAVVELSSAEQQLITENNNLDLARSNFNNMLNRPLDTEVSIVDNLGNMKSIYGDAPLEQLIALAYKNRQEIQVAEKTVKMAEENVKMKRSSYIPTLDLIGGYNWEGDKFFDEDDWQVGLSSSFVLTPADKAMISGAKSQVEQAKIQVDKYKQDISLEVRQAYLNVEQARKVLVTSEKTVAQAKEADKIAAVRYKEGVGTSVERIDAQTSLTQAETNYSNALYGLSLAKAQLEKSVGVSME